MDRQPHTQRKPMGTTRGAVCATLILGLLGCQSANRAEPPPVARAVQVAKATSSNGVRQLRLSGTIDSERSTVLSFAVIGTVERVFVEEGQRVKRGQLIARVSPRSYQDALSLAKSKASQAEDAQRRLRPMYENKTLPEVKMVEVDSGLEQARLAVSMAAKNLEDTVLRAPSDGIVARRSAESGTSVAPGVPVVTLVQTSTVLANAPVPETSVARVKPGDTARVFVSALGQWFDGTVRDIALIADPLTRTYATRISIPNRDNVLRIGMVAEIELNQANQPIAIVVPPETVRLDAQGAPFLFVLREGNRIERRAVKVAGYVGEGCALSQGVADGETVITSGTSMLEPGMVVRVVDRRQGGS